MPTVYSGKLQARPFITVVSGLPRSGTSMMMQMLGAGGMPLLTDGVRTSDEDNPRGYFEFEGVKKTREDSSWTSTAAGKAVKLVTVLLGDLPQTFEYRVILMSRDPRQIVASQKAMLDRLGRKGARVTDERLKELLKEELERAARWMSMQPNFRTLRVAYTECIQRPEEVAISVNTFLDYRCDTAQMASAVDSGLYRRV